MIHAGVHRRLILSLCLAALLAQGCSSVEVLKKPAENPVVVVEGMLIRNQLPFPITDVMINVPATGAYAGCGNVMPRSECRTSFEKVDYKANALVVSWKEYGKPHQTGEIVLALPGGLDPTRPAWLEVVVFAMGQAGAQFVQP